MNDLISRQALKNALTDWQLVDLSEWDNNHGFLSRDTAWMLWKVWDNKNRAKKTIRRGKR